MSATDVARASPPARSASSSSIRCPAPRRSAPSVTTGSRWGSKACPTDSIQFGSIVELRTRAQKRVDQLKSQGVKAELYGADPNGALGGLNSFYLLVDQPEEYGLQIGRAHV